MRALYDLATTIDTPSALDALLGPACRLSPSEVEGLRAGWTQALASYGLVDGGEPDRLISRVAGGTLERVRATGGDGDPLTALFDTRVDGSWTDAWFCREVYNHPTLERRPLERALFAVVALCREYDNLFLCVDMGTRLAAIGQHGLALVWMERAAGLIHAAITEDPATVGALPVYLANMAAIASDGGMTARAIRTEFLRHASDPQGCEFAPLSRYLAAHDATYSPSVDDILNQGFDLTPAIARFCGVTLATRRDGAAGGVTTSAVFHEQAHHVAAARRFGRIDGLAATTAPAATGTISLVREASFHVDFWKTLVVDRDGVMVRQFCSGAAEMPMLSERLGYRGRGRRLEGVTAFVSDRLSWGAFYHFLIEILPRFGMVLESGLAFDRVVAHLSRHRAAREAFAALGIPDAVILDEDGEIRGTAECLLIPSVHLHVTDFARGFLRRLFLGAEPRSQGRRLYISRKTAHTRRVLNEESLLDMLTGRGFEVVQLEMLPMREQARLMSEADIVFGPHGAGFANTVFCPPTATVVELMPEDGPTAHNHTYFFDLAGRLGLGYAAIEAPWDDAATHLIADVARCRAALDALLGGRT